MKFDKKIGLLFIALVLFVFVGLIMVNKKVEGMTGCNKDQNRKLRAAFEEYFKDNNNQTRMASIYKSAPNKFIKKNKKGKFEITKEGQDCLQNGGK
jgi:hypothetical protein